MDPMEKVTKAFRDALSEAFAPLLAAVRALMPAMVTTASVRSYIVGTTINGPIAPYNPKRRSILIVNAGSVAIEIGYSRGLVYGQGIPVPAGATFSDGVNPHLGEFFALTTSGTADTRIADVSYGEREQ